MLKLDWNSISHQPGVKEVYALPNGRLYYPLVSFTPVCWSPGLIPALKYG